MKPRGWFLAIFSCFFHGFVIVFYWKPWKPVCFKGSKPSLARHEHLQQALGVPRLALHAELLTTPQKGQHLHFLYMLSCPVLTPPPMVWPPLALARGLGFQH